MFISAIDVFNKMNVLGKDRKPFFFVLDFKATRGFICPAEDAEKHGILYKFSTHKNYALKNRHTQQVVLQKAPQSLEHYKKSFDIVHRNLIEGNSYLTNLTCQTPIELNIGLEEVFYRSQAKYKLWFNNEFVVFSPEIFVRIENGFIRSFPMKGTIDATIINARDVILNDYKETAEHNTIVDLIRNDLSMVSDNVRVERYRYIDEIKTNHKNLLQVSSEIVGELKNGYNAQLGTIFKKLLPAGSISGAPKKKTVEIIKEAETYTRGFYTGVMGYFDGSTLDSAVMIRFIQNTNGKLFFCSGGGITIHSNCESEYNEMTDKIYVPII